MSSQAQTRQSSAVASAGVQVFSALLVWNVGNFAFFLLAGRLLGVSDYGLLAALLAVTVAAAVPISAMQLEMARQVGAHGVAAASAVLRRAVGWSAVGGLALAALAILVTLALSVRVDLPLQALILTFAAVAPMPLLFTALGQLQGDHRFGLFAVSYGTMGGARPFLLLPLVAAGLAVAAGLLATLGAILAAMVIALVGCRRYVRDPGALDPAHWRELRDGVPAVAFGLVGIGVLTNFDIIAARIWLDAETAGEFAAVAVLAKAVIIVPQAVSTVLLPRVAIRHRHDVAAGELLSLGVLLALATGVLGALIALPAGELIVELTFGEEFTGLAWLLAPFAAASGILGALIVLVNHHVARRALRFAYGMGGLAVVFVVALAMAHDSPAQIVAVGAVVSALGLLVHEVLFAGTDESLIRGVRLLMHELRSRRA